MSEKLEEAIIDFVNALEAACIQLKQHIGERHGAGVREETFNILKFEKATGSRIGEFEVATKANNLPDRWNHAFEVLRKSNATINSRYHGEGYQFSYWLFGEDRIYRQLLKSK